MLKSEIEEVKILAKQIVAENILPVLAEIESLNKRLEAALKTAKEPDKGGKK